MSLSDFIIHIEPIEPSLEDANSAEVVIWMPTHKMRGGINKRWLYKRGDACCRGITGAGPLNDNTEMES